MVSDTVRMPWSMAVVCNVAISCWPSTLRTMSRPYQSGGATEELPEQRANGVPRDDRNDDVRHKDKRDQCPQFHLARLADY